MHIIVRYHILGDGNGKSTGVLILIWCKPTLSASVHLNSLPVNEYEPTVHRSNVPLNNLPWTLIL
jgi:hypothetical protein